MTDEPTEDANIDCACKTWCRDSSLLMTEHHRNCIYYAPEMDARKVIEALIKGIECWAQDEDGIHPECWKAYQGACGFVGQFHKLQEMP